MKDYGKGRYCRECGCELNRYNGDIECLIHNKVIAKHDRHPRSLCTSYKAYERNNEFDIRDSVFAEPGTERYDRLAFERDIELGMNIDGRFYTLDELVDLGAFDRDEWNAVVEGLNNG